MTLSSSNFTFFCLSCTLIRTICYDVMGNWSGSPPIKFKIGMCNFHECHTTYPRLGTVPESLVSTEWLH
jgi:hypothetical protein